MKNKIYSIVKATIPIQKVRQHEWLAKYRLKKPSRFETVQLEHFGLHDKDCILCFRNTDDKYEVIYNWETILTALASGSTEIEVTIIEALTAAEVPQIVALKNIRKRLTPRALGELIVDLKDYLKYVPEGIEFAKEIPGDNIDQKVATLLDYSYGMIQGYKLIYRNHPEYLDLIDKGRMSYTEAYEKCRKKAPSPDGQDAPFDEGDDREEDPVPPQPALKPSKPTKGPKYAGARHMLPCEPVKDVIIRYWDGREVNLTTSGESADGFFDGVPTRPLHYQAMREPHPQGAEYHNFVAPDTYGHIILEIVNPAGLMPDDKDEVTDTDDVQWNDDEATQEIDGPETDVL